MKNELLKIVNKLYNTSSASDLEILALLKSDDQDVSDKLFKKARLTLKKARGSIVYLRALIEVSNYCKRNCYYCGLRRDHKIERYRLSHEEILKSAEVSYSLGLRTFVLQAGEDDGLNEVWVAKIIKELKEKYPDVAITLSLGEKAYASYQSFKAVGADRYLLRHESFDQDHYEKLHPNDSSYLERQTCLNDLKELGYQVGCGMMIGSPYQTYENLLHDIRFLEKFKPEMIGIGPFIPACGTPFADFEKGDIDLTLRVLAIVRCMHPKALIPATTALASLANDGAKLGILAGANVIMPNCSPSEVRVKYVIYDNKKIDGSEAGENIKNLKALIKELGYEVKEDRGDF